MVLEFINTQLGKIQLILPIRLSLRQTLNPSRVV